MKKQNVGANSSAIKIKKHKYSEARIKENIELYSMLLPLLILIFIFCYIPIYGVVIAFQDYVPGKPFLAFDGSVEWVGLKYFIKFVKSIYFVRLIRNTLVLSGMHLAFGFVTPVIFALLLNEVRSLKYKKFVQTASYLPHFISTVIIAGLVISFFDMNGLVNNFLRLLGAQPQKFILNANAFPFIYTFTNVWASFGFGSILYFSVISSIDPCLYESVKIDGGNRLQQAWHITMPGLKNIIAIQLILTLGNILKSNTDMILLLYNPSTYDKADVIGTYIYRVGILEGQFSYIAAVGLFSSVIGFTLTFFANKLSDQLTGYSFW